MAHQNESIDSRGQYELAVTLLGDKLIGGISIKVSSRADKQAFIGYVLRRSVWGQGYGTEAAREIVRFGFVDLGMHRIYATCDIRNLASESVLRKAGMVLEGTRREHRLVRGKWRTSRLYSILSHEFRDAK